MAQTLLIAGASRGIGLEMARQAVARGDRVIATARGQDGLDRLTEIGAEAHPLDVTDEPACAALAEVLDANLDLLVVNAGIYRGRGGIDAEDMAADAWSDVLMTNVAGPFFVIRALLPRLGGGKVAVVSSQMGSSERSKGGSYIYRASKAAATNLACNLAHELAPQGIAVGSYHPGWVRTDMGGSSADVSVEDSAAGLLARFDHLSMATTGVFEDFRGDTIPF